MAPGEAGWRRQEGVITAEGGTVQSGLSVAGVRGEARTPSAEQERSCSKLFLGTLFWVQIRTQGGQPQVQIHTRGGQPQVQIRTQGGQPKVQICTQDSYPQVQMNQRLQTLGTFS